ncbi:MAG: DUF192 domain-containing protein [Candidatus Omnitrophica bacterium]|jgi:hypothetical protein|nr:DUF192 domain-containing protein [Candidatus Omnitrophota bacterium]
MDAGSKKIQFLIILFFLFTGIGLVKVIESYAGGKKLVHFKGNSFVVEVAETKQEQEKGLMYINRLASNEGMLFVYPDETRRSFYMKNTYLSLDLIWMDKEKRAVFIKRNAKPGNSDIYETVYPQEEAMYVLELNAGSADRIGLKVGDILQF